MNPYTGGLGRTRPPGPFHQGPGCAFFLHTFLAQQKSMAPGGRSLESERKKGSPPRLRGGGRRNRDAADFAALAPQNWKSSRIPTRLRRPTFCSCTESRQRGVSAPLMKSGAGTRPWQSPVYVFTRPCTNPDRFRLQYSASLQKSAEVWFVLNAGSMAETRGRSAAGSGSCRACNRKIIENST